jgi:hypothetical protein
MNPDNLNEAAQAERPAPHHAGLAEGSPKDILEPAPEPRRRYFEAMAWFESPDDAEEAKEDLAAAGYAFEQTPYVFDVHNGFLLAPTVYGVITGYTDEPDADVICYQLRDIIRAFGDCDCCGFVDAPTTQAERYHQWTDRDLADVQRAIEGPTTP